MRISQSAYYDNIYGANNSKLNKELFDVNKQIASGLKIQYAEDDAITFSQTMRLDNEVTTLGQIKKSTQSGYKVANQTDEVLNEFDTRIRRMRTLLVQAANGTDDGTSLDAIADEMKGIKKNLMGLANTSINGEFLFSGSATDIKPIADDGTYQGDNKALNAFIGSHNQQQYNLSGADLFLGEESNRRREVTSNVKSSNLVDSTKALTPDSTIRDLMGDIDNDKNTDNTAYFYLRGTKSDGSAFKDKFSLKDTKKISDLFYEIGKMYGNTSSVKVVNVSLNSSGEIVVQDKQKGSSKLDFHLVGAVDFSDSSSSSKANVNTIDQLEDNGGVTDYNTVKNDTTKNLFIHEFVKSGLKSSSGKSIEGIVYDRTNFTKDGFVLSANAPQVLRDGNGFATPSTKISEVADLSKGTAGTLNGTKLDLVGKDINGTPHITTIDFSANNSSFTVDGNTYHIYNVDGTKADGDKVTYQQLMDVVNMVTTNTLPASDSASNYQSAVSSSNIKGNTHLSYDGKLTFKDLQGTDADGTKADIALYDENSDDFTKDASVMTFNTNNALTISDPKTDFFKTIDEAITAVSDHKLYPDASSGTVRNVGIENALQKIDDLMNHVERMHAKVGAQSNTLSVSLQRTETLEISTKSLRSDVIDTDMAASALRLQQLTTNYQAMLSTVGKVSKLSLVNYL